MGAADFDLYEVLGVSYDASEVEIKQAYRQRALETHPDKNLDDMIGASKRFARVQEAYETLSDPMTRTTYDYKRENELPSEESPHHQEFPTAFDSTMPGQFRGQTETGTRPSSGGWFEWFSSWMPQSLTEPSDPLLRYIPEKYIARNKHITRPQGMSAQNIHEYVVLSMDKSTWEETGRDPSLFTLLRNLFECLAYDERRWGNTEPIPSFGYGRSAWCSDDDPQAQNYIQDFYEYWLNFKTRKPFDWVNPYYTDTPANAWVLQQIEKKNRVIHAQVQDQYNDFIRTLVDALLRCDPRFMLHVYIHFHNDNHPQTDEFYSKFVKRCRDKANKFKTRAQSGRPSQHTQFQQSEDAPKQKPQSRNQRKKQNQKNKAKQKKSW
ncbi:hypothetical protein CPB84DRAFT_1792103 [Gymnopilus junonius]|uniref:J domain-containing protein n=1 Tax=Gymnopilus junonius TaxID=109634 RepID=A0A9P5NDW8_GYMJU|nr:hypothetical protein CPB84DRAFT_1792103 [Gymnopilus junonius]